MFIFCSVCTETNGETIKQMPKNCFYDGFGVSICEKCCQACESYGACAEGFTAFPMKKEKKRENLGVFRHLFGRF